MYFVEHQHSTYANKTITYAVQLRIVAETLAEHLMQTGIIAKVYLYIGEEGIIPGVWVKGAILCTYKADILL